MPQARPLDPTDPERLGDYQIVGRLGQGGQGVVLLGHGPGDEQVAVKLLHARLSDNALARSRFIRELEVAKQVATFCTAAVLDADVAGDRPYIVSEYIDGPSLQDLVLTDGPRGRSALERLAIGTATALTAIHRAGVVHRDFKPHNVLLGNDGPRVIDFGIARAMDLGGLTLAGGVPGTPAYMAPEQLGGAEVGPAADVFAWGATMLFAASGRMPFGADSVPAVIQRVLYEEPDLGPLPQSLRGVVGEALSKDPARRPTARQLLDRLLGQESPVSDMPEPMVTEARTLAAERPPRPAPPTDTEPMPEVPAAPSPQGAAAASHGSGAAHGSGGGGWFGEGPEPQGASAPPFAASPYPPAGDAGQSETAVYSDLDGFTAASAQAGGGRQPSPIPWQRDGRAAHPPAGTPPQARSGGTHRPLGVLVSLAVGVLAGAAIIVLVLWPQMRDSGKSGGTAGTSQSAADDRPVSSIPQSFAGTWRGTAVNSQRQASFPIQVTFEAGRTVATAVYPRNCVCSLTLTGGTGVRLEMTLQPTGACRTVTAGNVVVTRKPGGGLDYAWARAGTSLSYRAALSRG
ncbi:Serine/threonine protein kinase [Thermomonospora echinospora]|uniref:Serine/threonine protein kinase n=1 Tax=Thermomonospora echinospora TaxID=1992 RepID=A0A1H6CLN6_9ACTN|nr:serine/threonine-protein kinase [Thermomonospora echinospora]SEG73356.1 Serine/threonine protein kinase [Thermomonospora echinospora]